jgi:flagellar biosynthesis protein FlhF
MQIKKFVAPSIKEATELMKNELGNNAIILHTRKISKSGMLKSFGGESIEITAGIDDQPLPVTENRLAQTYSKRSVQQNVPPQRNEGETPSSENVLESLKNISSEFEERLTDAKNQKSLPARAKEVSDIVQLKSDVEEVKIMLQSIATQLQFKHFGEMPEAVKEVYLSLLQQDIDEKIVIEITNKIIKKISVENSLSRINIEHYVMRTIADSIVTEQEKQNTPKKTKIVVLVGPTGVGKTTTIAKLAATDKLVHGKNVALISCDTYRIGAIEQLKTFAVIADIPMNVVYRASDLAAAIKKNHKADVIYIDTVGRGQRAKKDLLDLKKIVVAAHADEVHLVLSAQTNTATLRDIVARFEILSPTHLLFSKLDEAAIFGPLYNIAQKTRLPVSFFTTGQAVPDDISAADGTKFAAMLFEGSIAHA